MDGNSNIYVTHLTLCVHRIYLGYHTVDQVLAGLAIGYITGSLWYQRYMH